MIVELLKFHDARFDDALAVAQSLASGAEIGLRRRVGAI